MDNDKALLQIVDSFSALEQVEAILLAGSRATNTGDETSDYDLYIYTIEEIPVSTRLEITKEFSDYMEVNNQFWETEDDGIIRETNTPIDIIYRSLDWIDEHLERLLFKHQGGIGYSTCFWSNLLNSKILYDKTGRAQALQDKYNIAYPHQLKLDIIKKNYPLLRKQLPAYYFQIEKAVKRNDYISINHRVAAMLASYFDILFAINEMPHPGEKKLLTLLKEKCIKLPDDMEKNITDLLRSATNFDESILNETNKLIDNLDGLLLKENLYL